MTVNTRTLQKIRHPCLLSNIDMNQLTVTTPLFGITKNCLLSIPRHKNVSERHTISSPLDNRIASGRTVSTIRCDLHDMEKRRRSYHIPLLTNKLVFEEVVTHSRRKAVKTINLIVWLPEYPSDEFGQLEDTEDKRHNDQVFTTTLKQFYGILKGWQGGHEGDGKGSCRAAGIAVKIQAMSKSNP